MRVENLAVLSGQGSTYLLQGRGRIVWHSFKETTGAAAASYTFYDGPNAAAKVVLPVTLAAGGSARDYAGRWGIPFNVGLFFHLDSGSVEGNLVVEFTDAGEESPIPVVIVESANTLIVTPPPGA